MPHGSNFEDGSEHTETDGNKHIEVVVEFEIESQHDSLGTKTLTQTKKSTS